MDADDYDTEAEAIEAVRKIDLPGEPEMDEEI